MRNVNHNYVSGIIRPGSCLASISPPYTIPRSNDKDQLNRLMATHYTANLLNQYTAIGATTPTYDADGNLLTGYNDWTLEWNGENRLKSMFTATAKLEFAYDYMGRRFSKKVYTKSGATWILSNEKKFVYDGYKQIGEYAGVTATMLTVWQPESSGDFDVPLWSKTGTEVQTYIVDGNKNVRQLKNAAGTVITTNDYDPFGNVTSTGTPSPWQFSSEYRDAETNLIYYNYRYYAPTIGRWINRDPIAERGGLNLYVSMHNSVLVVFDFLGLKIKITPYDVGVQADYYKRDYKDRKGKEPSVPSQKNIENVTSFEVYYDGECLCCDGKKGTIVFKQEIFRPGGGCSGPHWTVDGHEKGREEFCPSTGKNVKREPTYRSGSDGARSPNHKDGYLDAPANDNKFRVSAYCRCPCEDDKLLDKKEFSWSSTDDATNKATLEEKKK